jgi:uncharacterized protein
LSTFLLDVNVLIALAWPSHVHHLRARTWFAKKGAKAWATCPITQCAFVRISSNPRVFPQRVSPLDALNMLSAMTGHSGHVFWTDAVDMTGKSFSRLQLAGHGQVTDAYLLLLAESRKGVLATFDRTIGALYARSEGGRPSIELIG